jgi:uncharacterized membrane protein
MNRNMKTDHKKRNRQWIWITVVTTIVVLVFCAAYYFVINKYIGVADNAGIFGDQFGGLNALFSGLAFAALVVTLLMQREELELQREELKSTRDEIAGQRLALERQAALMSQQTAVDTFYRLLSLHREVVAKDSKYLGGISERDDLRWHPFQKCTEAILGHIRSVEISDKKFYLEVFRATLAYWELQRLDYYRKDRKNKDNRLTSLIEELSFDTDHSA